LFFLNRLKLEWKKVSGSVYAFICSVNLFVLLFGVNKTLFSVALYGKKAFSIEKTVF